MILYKNRPSPSPSDQSGSPPIHNRVEDCALLVILGREMFGSTFAFDIVPLRQLRRERSKQAGGG